MGMRCGHGPPRGSFYKPSGLPFARQSPLCAAWNGRSSSSRLVMGPSSSGCRRCSRGPAPTIWGCWAAHLVVRIQRRCGRRRPPPIRRSADPTPPASIPLCVRTPLARRLSVFGKSFTPQGRRAHRGPAARLNHASAPLFKDTLLEPWLRASEPLGSSSPGGLWFPSRLASGAPTDPAGWMEASCSRTTGAGCTRAGCASGRHQRMRPVSLAQTGSGWSLWQGVLCTSRRMGGSGGQQRRHPLGEWWVGPETSHRGPAPSQCGG